MSAFLNRRNGFTLLGLMLTGLVLNFLIQAASMKMDVGRVCEWIWAHGWLYAIGSFILFFILLAIAAVVSNVYAGSLLVAILIGLLATANYQKLNTTGEPLFPWDLMQIKNASAMGDITEGMISPLMIVIAAVILAGAIALVVKLPKVRLHLGLRVVYAVVSILAVIGFMHVLSGNHAKLFDRVGYANYFWNPKINYAENGFVFAFTADLKQTLFEEPEGYSKEKVLEIAHKYEALAKADEAAGTTASGAAVKLEQPNIVYVQDEAFFDVTRLSAYTYSEDPIDAIHGLEARTPSGWMLSPEFGGSTANVEFEALTGMSNYFLNGGTVPYQQAVVRKSSMPSIVSILKERGYDAIALHPFDKTFYNRNQVYPVLGFDTFIGSKDMKHTERMTPDAYVTDLSAFKETIDLLKEADKPTFLHLVTMQNHYPFIEGKNGPNTVQVEGLDGKLKTELESYTQGTKLTDEAVAYLVDALAEIDRPTVVVFWGDHLPALNEQIYQKTNWADEQKLRHETPLLFFGNIDLGTREMGSLSPAFIGPTVFELTGQSLPPYYKLLQQVKTEVPGLSRSVLAGPDGQIEKLSESQQAVVDEYRLIEYDLLMGEGYSKRILFPETEQ